jgi:hypothetical protein
MGLTFTAVRAITYLSDFVKVALINLQVPVL